MWNQAPVKDKPYQILVIDDTLANLQLLSDILINHGYQVRPASSGQLALKSVAVQLPDLILLDVKMPGLDGYEVCRILKADEKTRKIPIIFISNLDEVTDKVKGFDLGGVDYVTKPFQPEEIIARVGTHLTIGRMQAQLKEQNYLLQKENEALRISEERFSKAFHSSPAIMAIINKQDECYIDVNDKWLSVFGFTRSEVIGRSSKDLNLYVEMSHRAELFRRIKETGSIQSSEERLINKKGDFLTHIISMEVIQMDGRECLLATGIDITEKVQIGEKLEQSRQENKDTKRKIGDLKKLVAQSIGLGNIYYASESMRLIINEAQKYHTDRSITVLIQGETGTGKELIARLIHFGNLEVLDKPFIDINCAAISPQLFESEFFGYESGAFTGGLTKGQIGKFDLAWGGTIFLDEIAEIPLELQGKLLRVIQEKNYYRVGGINKIKSNVRIICATNVDIEQKVIAGKFRKDLFYRLKVGSIKIPPLRNRRESILPLASAFLKEFSHKKGKNFKEISSQAADILTNHHWPGNVRELENLIEWVVFMHDDSVLQPFHLEAIHSGSGYHVKKIKGTIDHTAIGDTIYQVKEALELFAGNKTKAAKHLGISRPTLYKLLRM